MSAPAQPARGAKEAALKPGPSRIEPINAPIDSYQSKITTSQPIQAE
jgi:hypothetical protein